MDSRSEAVQLRLSPDEALVLFDWLSKRDDDDALDPLIEHWSEQLVLWRLLGQLEKKLVEPFHPKYSELLSAAQERLVADIPPEDRKRAR
jgi:hypothetical protein